ncbi:type II toxin-antitoxin system HicB family antitoxin [Chryseobacterium koreense]|uniref:type II toxin-antitoxin system HicB family antitoxin n=1 Tax=Chryseobacterium koreense TaxID=232216 RepID=UPI0026F369CB|nr:type II toxin-antitoxin system HicB family antitoxin [Chryseobacterium koreense]
METLKYKDFYGSIEVNQEDDTLYGKVLGLEKSVLITYEGNTVAELKKDFKNAVDDYLEHCKEHNLPTHKSYSGTLNVRLTPQIHAKIAQLAEQAGLSINAFIKETLQKAMM